MSELQEQNINLEKNFFDRDFCIFDPQAAKLIKPLKIFKRRKKTTPRTFRRTAGNYPYALKLFYGRNLNPDGDKSLTSCEDIITFSS